MLDEPAAGLSPAEIEQLNRTLVGLREETGVAILLVEHVISLVMNVCERITVLDRGAVIAQGPPAQVAAGDRIMFLKNERGLGVRNGTLGKVEQVSPERMAVKLDDGRSVALDRKRTRLNSSH